MSRKWPPERILVSRRRAVKPAKFPYRAAYLLFLPSLAGTLICRTRPFERILSESTMEVSMFRRLRFLIPAVSLLILTPIGAPNAAPQRKDPSPPPTAAPAPVPVHISG